MQNDGAPYVKGYVMSRSSPNRPALVLPVGVSIEDLRGIGPFPRDDLDRKQCYICFFRKSSQGYDKIPHEFLMGFRDDSGYLFICDSPQGLLDLYLKYINQPENTQEDRNEKERLWELLAEDLDEIAEKYCI